MTTAHRPTWKAAVGQANEGGWGAGGARSSAISALDAPAHTKLKFRQGSSSSKLDRDALLKQSLLQLEEAEQTHQRTKNRLLAFHRPIDPEVEKAAELKLLKQTADIDEVKLKQKYNDSDVEDSDDDSNSNNKNAEKRDGGELDADNETDLDDDSDDDDDDSDDDDDDEAALQAELAKIRAEREEAKRKAQEQEAAEEEEKQQAAALLGNPLLLPQQGQALDEQPIQNQQQKRRQWNDDVVFRHQAKGEPVAKKRFINDTVRNDFHKRFLNKFIR